MTQALFHAWLSTELLGRLPTLFIGRLVRCSTPGRFCKTTDYATYYMCKIYQLIFQGRSHQIWSDQVGSARIRTLYPRGVWGHAPPGKF